MIVLCTNLRPLGTDTISIKLPVGCGHAGGQSVQLRSCSVAGDGFSGCPGNANLLAVAEFEPSLL
jgi:hypothetical protein